MVLTPHPLSNSSQIHPFLPPTAQLHVLFKTYLPSPLVAVILPLSSEMWGSPAWLTYQKPQPQGELTLSLRSHQLSVAPQLGVEAPPPPC